MIRPLCKEPIATGAIGKRATYEPCGRELWKDTGMCRDHAIEAGLVKRASYTAAAREAMAAARRKKKVAIQ